MRSRGWLIACLLPLGCGQSANDAARTVVEQVRSLPLPARDPGGRRARVDVRAPGGFAVEDADSGLAIDVRLDGARLIPGHVHDGLVAYPGALAGADIVHRLSDDGIEDFLAFPAAPRTSEVAYRVTLGDKVAGLRLVSNTLEFLDSSGTPRLRAANSRIFDRDLHGRDAGIAVEGCAVSTDPAAPWGRPVTPPGAETCTVRVSWNSQGLRYPAVLDPAWTATAGSMHVARASGAAAFIPASSSNGPAQVVVAGPEVITDPNFTDFTYAELYDPVSKTFAASANVSSDVPRYGATLTSFSRTATTCSDCTDADHMKVTMSRVGEYALIFGGFQSNVEPSSSCTSQVAQGFVAVYDPKVGDWTASRFPTAFDPQSQFVTMRAYHTATVIPSGRYAGKILIVGGRKDCSSGAGGISSAILFNPDFASLETAFTAVPAADQPLCGHARHTATVIPGTNKILIAGGFIGTSANPLIASPCVEVYDPEQSTLGKFSRLANLTAPRAQHAAGAVTFGSTPHVVVAGGITSTCSTLDVNNDCVCTGACANLSAGLATAESYTPDSWSLLGALLATGRLNATGTSVGPGLLLVGGLTQVGGTVPATSELLDPAANGGAGAWRAAANVVPRYAHAVSLIPATTGGCPGNVLVAGGLATDSGGHLLTSSLHEAEVFDPTLGQACAVAGDCCSNSCVGGVCCDTSCDGECQTCATGTCTLQTAGQACAVPDGNPCTTDTCDGISTDCQHAAGNLGAVCRASGGECDPQEVCTGSSTTCPTDLKSPNGTSCTTDGNPCTLDQCDGSSVACQHPAGNLGAVCRASGGECDPQEVCTGSSATCPPDLKSPNGTSCASDGNACTLDQCNGSSVACQHPAGNLGAVCRPSGGECDPQEVCTGGSATCPPDLKSPNGTSCASDGNACTLDQCNGSSVACQHPAGNAGAVCRAAAGNCDSAASCTGSSPNCPANGLLPSTTICRGSAGPCDPAEHCTGGSVNCPGDARSPNGASCPADSNPCTLDQCDGASAACGHPAGNAGTVCRAAAGDCDVAEKCTGNSVTCPSDGFAPAITECRASAGVCDPAEHCTGSSARCPADSLAAAGAACPADSDACTADQCDGAHAACQHPAVVCPASAPVCNAGTGACVECSAGHDAFCTSMSQVCDVAAGNCVECLTSSQCPIAKPFCNAHVCQHDCFGNGPPSCADPALPACSSTTGACVECNQDEHSLCTGQEPFCNQELGICVGCRDGGDCPGSGVCNPISHACGGAPTPDAGVPDASPDATPLPPDAAIDAGAPDARPLPPDAALDAGVPDAAVPDAARPDAVVAAIDANVSGSTHDAESLDAEGKATAETGGCGCRTAPRQGRLAGPLALLLIAGVVVRRRRK